MNSVGRARSRDAFCVGMASVVMEGVPLKRGPGRPRKHPLPEALDPGSLEYSEKAWSGEGVGDNIGDGPLPAAMTAAPKKRGRPRKHPLPSSSGGTLLPNGVAKRKPGRPPGRDMVSEYYCMRIGVGSGVYAGAIRWVAFLHCRHRQAPASQAAATTGSHRGTGSGCVDMPRHRLLGEGLGLQSGACVSIGTVLGYSVGG